MWALHLTVIMFSITPGLCQSLEQAETISNPLVCSTQCKSKDINGTATAMFCDNSTDLVIHGRCCLNASLVLGLDLHGCNLTDEKLETALENLNELKYLSVEDNPIHEVTVSELQNNTGIEYLSLPLHQECPGGSAFWRERKDEKNKTICIEQLDPCEHLKCPENSHCVHSEFNSTECLCDVGYHGYKCMNQGTFPLIPFLIGVSVPTVVICALLWVTQRRYVVRTTKQK